MSESDYSSEPRHPHSTAIRDDIFEFGLNPYEFAVYGLCQRLLQDGVEELPSNRELCKWLRISAGSMSKTRRALDMKGLLPYEQGRHHEAPGDVYLIECSGLHKIGMSKDAESRISEIRSYLPWPVRVVCRVRTDNALGLERKLHHSVWECRVKGEWFQLSDEQVEDIIERMWAGRS